MDLDSFQFDNCQGAGDYLFELERFIEYWLGPREDSYGTEPAVLAELSLPGPLLQLYRFAGNWPSPCGRQKANHVVPAFSKQNSLRKAQALNYSSDNEYLIFINENQGVWELITRASGDDPEVWLHYPEYGDWQQSRDQWLPLHPSLAEFLACFCLRELVFGSKELNYDTHLLKHFQNQPSITLWRNARFSDDTSFDFYLYANGAILECEGFFASNTQVGIDMLNEHQSPISRISLNTQTSWALTINEDGSGDIGVFLHSDSKAEIPKGTFDFYQLLEALQNSISSAGDCGSHPWVAFFREGTAAANGQPIENIELVTQSFQKGFRESINAKGRFHELRRTVALMG